MIDTKTLEQTKPNKRIPALIVRFAGCPRPLWLTNANQVSDGDVWETLNLALEEVNYFKKNEMGEAEILTISVGTVDEQEFNNAEEWYC